MKIKTQMSRFQIHDDLSAPEGSVAVLKGAMSGGGQLPNFLGVLAGSLAIAEHYGSAPGTTLHSRTARQEGLGLDEVALAREWNSLDGRELVLLRLLRELVVEHHGPPAHFVEEAREAGWSDAQLLEAIAFAAQESFTAMVNVAGDVPVDGSIEASRTLRAA
jgi:alkylhydroperoxidase family enzyme